MRHSASCFRAVARATVCFAAMVAAQVEFPPLALAQEGGRDGNAPFAADETVEDRALRELWEHDLDQITVGQLTGFHNLLIQRCGAALPDGLEIRYLGSVAASPGGLKIEGHETAGALNWSVEKSVQIFTSWISTRRTNETVASVKIKCAMLYVNVGHVDEFRSIGQPMPKLGGRSVKDILGLLNDKKFRNHERSGT